MEIDCSDDEDQSDYGDHFVGLTDMVTVQERENPPSGGFLESAVAFRQPQAGLALPSGHCEKIRFADLPLCL